MPNAVSLDQGLNSAENPTGDPNKAPASQPSSGGANAPDVNPVVPSPTNQNPPSTQAAAMPAPSTPPGEPVPGNPATQPLRVD
jgi:hypothetical protein